MYFIYYMTFQNLGIYPYTHPNFVQLSTDLQKEKVMLTRLSIISSEKVRTIASSRSVRISPNTSWNQDCLSSFESPFGMDYLFPFQVVELILPWIGMFLLVKFAGKLPVCVGETNADGKISKPKNRKFLPTPQSLDLNHQQLELFQKTIFLDHLKLKSRRFARHKFHSQLWYPLQSRKRQIW